MEYMQPFSESVAVDGTQRLISIITKACILHPNPVTISLRTSLILSSYIYAYMYKGFPAVMFGNFLFPWPCKIGGIIKDVVIIVETFFTAAYLPIRFSSQQLSLLRISRKGYSYLWFSWFVSG
jgi:hypothetical protein